MSAGAGGGQKGAPDPLELGRQVVVSSPTWVLRPLILCERSASVLFNAEPPLQPLNDSGHNRRASAVHHTEERSTWRTDYTLLSRN